MEITIEIPDNVIQRAEALGLPVSTLVSQALDQIVEEPVPPGFVRLGKSSMTRAEATASILEIQRTHTLGGLKIKDLIEEGRRL
jgi:hypothetical protein